MYNKDILAYKGFNKDLKCKGYQFEVGKTFEHDREVIVCESGFHACKNPLDVLSHYPIVGSRFAVVKCSGEISEREGGDSKIACGKLVVEVEIKLPELIKKGVDWILSKVDFDDKGRKIANNSTATVTGDWSTAAATGFRSTAAATGHWSTAATARDWSTAAATGDRSTAVATGGRSTTAATGYWSKAATIGVRSTAAATGVGSTAAATGDGSTAAATGYWSTAAATGDGSTAVATGSDSSAEVSGGHSVACALGSSSKAKADKNGAIVCVYVDDNTGELIHIKASKVGENGIKPDTWYTLDSDGNFKEVE